MNEDIMRQAGLSEQMDLVKERKCPTCATPMKVTEFRDQLSVDEWKISGMCQKCQDSVFGESEEQS